MHKIYIDQHGTFYAACVYNNTNYVTGEGGLVSFVDAVRWCQNWLTANPMIVEFQAYASGDTYPEHDNPFDIMDDECLIEAYLKL